MRASSGFIGALLIGALVCVGMAGCNTFRGAGKDIQQGGQAVEDAADDVQKANRHPGPRTITAWADRGGSISPSGGHDVRFRSNRTYNIRPDRGYHVADVLVDGKSVGAVSRYTFDNVTENHTISALFTVNPVR